MDAFVENLMIHLICFQHIALEIKADLENVTNLIADGEDFRWYLKVSIIMSMF